MSDTGLMRNYICSLYGLTIGIESSITNTLWPRVLLLAIEHEL